MCDPARRRVGSRLAMVGTRSWSASLPLSEQRYQDVMSVQEVAADLSRRRNSMVPPMATCPVPVPPVRSRIISVSVRSVIITGRIVARAVKHWYWKRNRESDENSSLGLRLEKHRHGKNKRKDQKKSSHIAKLPDEPADQRVTECRVFSRSA